MYITSFPNETARFEKWWEQTSAAEGLDPDRIEPEGGINATAHSISMYKTLEDTRKRVSGVLQPPQSIARSHIYIDYFDAEPRFIKDLNNDIETEFRRFAAMHGWQGNDDFWDRRATCLSDELYVRARIKPQHRSILEQLVVDVGAGKGWKPLSRDECKAVLQDYNVNLIDYINCKRSGRPVGPVFDSKYDLRMYTIRERKVFPKESAMEYEELHDLLSVML